MASARREMTQAEAEDLLVDVARGKEAAEITNVQFAPGVRWKPAEARRIAFVTWSGRELGFPGAG